MGIAQREDTLRRVKDLYPTCPVIGGLFPHVFTVAPGDHDIEAIVRYQVGSASTCWSLRRSRRSCR